MLENDQFLEVAFFQSMLTFKNLPRASVEETERADFAYALLMTTQVWINETDEDSRASFVEKTKTLYQEIRNQRALRLQ